MNAITLPNPSQIYLVIGGHSAAQQLLQMAAHLALRGPLLLLDCGNRANPLPLVRELRRQTPDPVHALQNIHSARAFTCNQVLALLAQTAGAPVQQPVLVFDLLATFYDESISFGEGRRLLAQSLGCLRQIRQTAPLLISARPPLAAFPQRKIFLELLLEMSDRTWLEETPQPPQINQLSFFA